MEVAVFTLGFSPPIATEFLLELKLRGVEVSKAIAVTTKGAAPSFHALKIAFAWASRISESFPALVDELQVGDLSSIDLRCKQLTIDDISEPGDCRTFRSQLSSALTDALRWARRDPGSVHVCVAGGRKTMPIDAVLVSLAHGLTGVYHVIAPKISGIAEEFAKTITSEKGGVLRGDLEKFARNPDQAPRDLIEKVLRACFPPKELKVHLIRIPLPRLPDDERRRLQEELVR